MGVGDDDFRAALVEGFDNPIGVKGFIRNQPAEMDAFMSGSTPRYRTVARKQFETHQIAQRIGESQDFRRHPALDLPMAWL